MKILYVTNTSYEGGSTIALVNIIRGMKQFGHEIFVLTNSNKGFLYELLSDVDVKIFSCNYCLTIYPLDKNPVKYIYGFFLHFYWWYNAKRYIGKIIDEYNIDIVHTNVGPLDLALSECVKRGIPHVWHQREFFDKFCSTSLFPNNKYFYDRIQTKGNYNICITRQVLDNCRLSENFCNRVIYDGVFKKSQLPKLDHVEKEKYILFVGRVEPNKGLDDLLLAFADFNKKYPKFTLKVVGSYNDSSLYFKTCKRIINEYSLQNSVNFLGSRTDIYLLMAHAQALVVASHFEGFGFATVEAMINKTIVIGRNTSGTKEQFDIGLNLTGQEIGFRFSNKEQLQKELCEIVEKDNATMIRNAYKVASELYTVEKCVDSINKLYIDCIKKE
ncbi:glycosyl transferase group 1 [Bacteroides sp. CAG:530]|nr:glycosyl transferase group 1 [Bacteroides sp. CAG:530]